MKAFRISKCKYIDDLGGTGAAYYPGRWHSRGTHILYAASSPSLALLESVVHISDVAVPDYCLICLEIGDNYLTTVSVKDLPENWNANPSPEVLRAFGDDFIRTNKYLAMLIPSAIMPEENNILLNPAHASFNKITIEYKRNVTIDGRLVKK